MKRADLIEEIIAYLRSLGTDEVDARAFDAWSDEDLRRFAPRKRPRTPHQFSCDAEMLPNGCAIIRLGGKFDDWDSQQFYGDVRHLLQQGCTRLILDCGHLTDISTAGVAMIAHTLRLTRERGGRVILSELQARVDRKFEKLGFKPFFATDGRSPRPVNDPPTGPTADDSEGVPSVLR